MSAEEIGNCPIADKDNLAACLKCVDSESVEWEVFGNELNFEEAREVCQGVDGGDLAQIKSEFEFDITNRLFEAAAGLVDDKVEFWIGKTLYVLNVMFLLYAFMVGLSRIV